MHLSAFKRQYAVFSLTWPASMQIYWHKRKPLHKKRVQLPQDWIEHQHRRRFIVFGRHDVMRKHTIKRGKYSEILFNVNEEVLTRTDKEII